MASSLDNQSQVSIPTENKTLVGIPDGIHSIALYATNLAGNTGASEPIQFTVSPKATATQTVFSGANLSPEYGYAIVAFVITVVVGLALLVYFKKRRK